MPAPYAYRLFGLTLSSALELPELLLAGVGKTPDVVIELGDVAAGDVSNQTPQPIEGGSVIAVAGVARFAIRGGRSIIVDADPAADPRNVRLYLLGSAMGMLLHQRGVLPLHANAIEIDGRAYAFMGPSGAGKSTLAAWFHDNGHRVIADDVCAIGFSGDGDPLALPGLPRLRLARDALEHSGRLAGDWPQSYAGDTFVKFDVAVGAALASRGAVPLAAIYVLGPGKRFVIRALTGIAAADALFANTYRGAFVGPAQTAGEHLVNCARVATRVPIYQLQRPLGHALMDRQGAQLVDHFAYSKMLTNKPTDKARTS